MIKNIRKEVTKMYSTWTRRDLKIKAKSALKGNYWKAFIVSLVLAIISTASGSGSGSGSGSNTINEQVSPGMMRWAFTVLIVGIIILVVRLIIGYAIEVGVRKFFIRSSEGESEMSYLLYGFKKIDILIYLRRCLQEMFIFFSGHYSL